MKSETGNVLFMILIAVGLFAALSYAVTQSGQGGAGGITTEQAKLDQAVIDNYMTAIRQGQMTLNLVRGCDAIDYTPPSEWGVDEKRCHMFHPEGGDVWYQDLGLDSCTAQGGDPMALVIGESCGNIVYAGESGGNRIYTTAVDQGTSSWNNGTGNWAVTGAISTSDGLANTNTLIALADAGAPYQAAVLCRALGTDWYLPSRDELNLLYTNQDTGSLSGTFSPVWHWTSVESGSDRAWGHNFGGNQQSTGTKDLSTLKVRCVRRD